MKRTTAAILPLVAFFLVFTACTRIDTTELGDELIPAVDNVNTFDMTLDVNTDNLLLQDSLPVLSNDALPVGEIFNDPEFGRTVSNLFFTVYPDASYGRPGNPFNHPDSVKGVDSVVLQLAITGTYGDTNNIQTFVVHEIAQGAGFKDSAYRLGHGSFPTAGILGSKAVDFTKFNDTQRVNLKDTFSKVVNVLRIKLNTSFGDRLADYDTLAGPNGGFRNDSIFATLFRGLAVTVDSNKAGNRGLAYIDLSNANTKLEVYYRTQRAGKIDTTVANFVHSGRRTLSDNSTIAISGRVSTIRREAQHGYATYLSNGTPNDDRLYIQSTPGSYGLINIPGLDTMQNKVIHRAELIFSKISTPAEDIFTIPNLLFMDMITDDKDTAFTVQNDFVYGNGGANFNVFGGALRTSDQTYRFNITRHVQGIITRDEKNFGLRVYAPYLTLPYYVPPGKASDYDFTKLQKVEVPIIGRVAAGRVVLQGGAAVDPTKKARLYVVYSKI